MTRFYALLTLLLPSLTYAETDSSIKNLEDLVNWILDNFVNSYLIPMLIAIAFLFFFWRNVVALFKADDTVKKSEFKSYLLWAVVALFILMSFWGVLGIFTDAFNIKNGVPQLRSTQGPGPVVPGDGGNSGDNGSSPCLPTATSDC
jgi:hypothetical protein